MSQTQTVINRGKRVFTLRPAADGTPRVLDPGKSIDCLDEAEFKHLTRYTDVVDAQKAVPAMANRQAQLEQQLAAAREENARLKSAAPVENTPETETPHAPRKKRKGK